MKAPLRKLAFMALCAAGLAGCKESGPGAQTTPAADTLNVIAGSELKDIEPLLPLIQHATGVQLHLDYAGTLDAVERIQSGAGFDAAWLASNRYAMLIPEVREKVAASDRTMLTPVVLGLKESKARELGWIDNPDITWKTIADAAADGRFTFGMTNPASSNTGFSGLLGIAAALAGKGDALEESDIDEKQLSSFFRSQRLTSGSSGWLAEAFLADQDKVDGLINYAATFLQLNQNPELKEKFVLIYPQDGLLTSDYPLMLLNSSKREAYDKVIAFVRGAEFQKAMTATTLRRPVNPDVQSADTTNPPAAELPFPAKQAVVDAILSAFDNTLRLPTDSTFVLDVSGSMEGSRLADMKHSMVGLSGADRSVSGKYSRFRNRERVYLLPFSGTVGRMEEFVLGSDSAANAAVLAGIAERVGQLRAGGGTAMFDAARQAYLAAASRRRAEPDRFYSVVILSDGESNEGLDQLGFYRWYQDLPDQDKGIKIFPVLFGDADAAQMKSLAMASGGRVFDSRKSDLRTIFKDIRGYQ